jgi:hypothetical protein
MSGVPARYVRLLIDQFDFSTDTSGLTLALNVAAIDAPSLQMDALQRLAGMSGAKLEHNGYYTGPDVGNLERELSARLGTQTAVTLMVLLDTRTIGNPAYVLPATWGEQLTIEAPLSDLLTLSGAWGEMPAQRGIVLLDGAVTATGTGGVVTLPVGSVAGGHAYLSVRALSGVAATDIQVLVQSDDNAGMSSPTNLDSFDFDAVGVYSVVIGGAIDRYLRIQVADLGGADGFTATLVVCPASTT